MGRKIRYLALFAGLAAASSAPLARADGDGWAPQHHGCGCVRRPAVRHLAVRHVVIRHEAVRQEVASREVETREVVTEVAPPPDDAVRLPASFFADAGGVGPAFLDYGDSGGGIVIVSGGRAGAAAFASARASTQASASFSFGGHQHMGAMHGGGMKSGGKW